MTPEGLAAALAAAPREAWLAAGGLGMALAVLVWRGARARARLVARLSEVSHAAAEAARAQDRTLGALTQVAQAQAAAQARLSAELEIRLDRVQERMTHTLGSGAERTADSLGRLGARLATIDAAQARIERLSGEMRSLQDILSDKQARGAFGEIQLAEILRRALPADGFQLQPTLSNGRRPDALVHLAGPPGTLVVDAKFPLEAYHALVAAGADAPARARALRALAAAVRSHVRAIRERYVAEGDTADQALMFVPSEAVYATLHAELAGVVREGFDLRVWIVSPTTLMAVLHTMRGVLRDARVQAEATRLRRELALLHGDVGRLVERVEAAERHLARASEAVAAVRAPARRAAERAARLEALDLAAGPDCAEARPIAAGHPASGLATTAPPADA